MRPRASINSCDEDHVGGYATSRSAAASVQCRLSEIFFALLVWLTTTLLVPFDLYDALISTNVSQRANQLHAESSGEYEMYLQASHPRHSRAQAAASATRCHEPLVAGDGGGEPGARYLVSQVDVVVTFDLAAGMPQDPCRHGLRHQLGLELDVFEGLWRVATRESSICL